MGQTKKAGLFFIGEFPEGDVHASRIRNITDGLIEGSWSCDLVSMYPTRFSSDFCEDQVSDYKGQLITRIGNWGKYPATRLSRIGQLIRCHIQFILFIWKNRRTYDIQYFYTPQWISTLPGLIISKILRNTIVVDYTDLHSTRNNAILHKTEEWIFFGLSDQVLVISNYLYVFFNRWKKKMTLVPLMIDFNRFENDVERVHYSIGYIGSFGKKDGFQTILDALQLAVQENKSIHLYLIGDLTNNRDIHAAIEQKGLGKNIVLIGKVKVEEIAKRLQSCSAFIMNRDKSSFASSGYPIKLGEYLASDRPVLMSDGPGYSEDFSHLQEAIKYKVDDAQALADAIIFRYENEMLAWEVSQRGYDYAVAHFESKKQVKKLVEILDEL